MPTLTPKEFQLPFLPFDVAAHPDRDLIAVASIDGNIFLLSVQPSLAEVKDLKHHSESCRRVIFLNNDNHLVSVSSDQSICHTDVETLKAVKHRKEAHKSPIYSVCEVREHILATGDDDGVIKLWDDRQEECIMTQPEHSNFISSLTVDSTGSTLLATSGDAMLSVWNSRQRKLIARSDEGEAELLTCDIMRSGTKVVCGTGDGILNIFSWGDWGDITDRLPLQIEDITIDSTVQYSDTVILMGCSDGVIRASTVFPHNTLEPLGDHVGEGVEGMCLLHDDSQLITVGQDSKVRCWGTSTLDKNIDKALASDSEDSEAEERVTKKRKGANEQEDKKLKDAATFFGDL